MLSNCILTDFEASIGIRVNIGLKKIFTGKNRGEGRPGGPPPLNVVHFTDMSFSVLHYDKDIIPNNW